MYAALLPQMGLTGHRHSAALERAVLIKDGFSWPAFFFGIFWILSKRLWLVALGYLAVSVMLQILFLLIGPVTGWIGFLLIVFFALNANDLWRWALVRRGWRITGLVTAPNRVEAERRFYTKMNPNIGGAPDKARTSVRQPMTTARGPLVPSTSPSRTATTTGAGTP